MNHLILSNTEYVLCMYKMIQYEIYNYLYVLCTKIMSKQYCVCTWYVLFYTLVCKTWLVHTWHVLSMSNAFLDPRGTKTLKICYSTKSMAKVRHAIYTLKPCMYLLKIAHTGFVKVVSFPMKKLHTGLIHCSYHVYHMYVPVYVVYKCKYGNLTGKLTPLISEYSRVHTVYREV